MTANNDPAFRITALWAFSECALGGIMHALKLPFTGLFVGGFAVLCIGLLAHMTQRNAQTLLQATILVLLVKAIVSPHSPPAAYIAVGFQGLAGTLLLCYVRPYAMSAFIFGFVSMVESALQKVLVLFLFFGKPLFEAFDLFTADVLKTFGWVLPLSGSEMAGVIFVGFYALWGLLLGYWILRLPAQLERQRSQYAGLQLMASPPDEPKPARKKRPWLFPAIVLIFVATVFLFTGGKSAGMQKAVYAVLRSVAVLSAWFFLLQPLVTLGIQRWAKRKSEQEKGRLSQVLETLPEFRNKAAGLYRHVSNTQRGWKKWRAFVVGLFIIAIYPEP